MTLYIPQADAGTYKCSISHVAMTDDPGASTLNLQASALGEIITKFEPR